MERTNNVDIQRVRQFAQQVKADPARGRMTQVIAGEWLAEAGMPQFRATVRFEGGETVMESDSPTMLGGSGLLPGPLHYCYFGLAACYTSTFVTMATELGAQLHNVQTRVEADVNLGRMLGAGDEPIVSEVRVVLRIESDAPMQVIQEAEALAMQRCPAVYTLTNTVELKPYLEVIRGEERKSA